MTIVERVGVVVFMLYALALLIATHWPGVVIQGPVARTDLWIHAAAYFGLTALGLMVLGHRRGLSRARMRWCCLAFLALAALDELTQPWFGRVAAISDWLADAVGIMGACVLISAILEVARRNPRFQGIADRFRSRRPHDGVPPAPEAVSGTTPRTDEPTHGPRPKDTRVRA